MTPEQAAEWFNHAAPEEQVAFLLDIGASACIVEIIISNDDGQILYRADFNPFFHRMIRFPEPLADGTSELDGYEFKPIIKPTVPHAE